MLNSQKQSFGQEYRSIMAQRLKEERERRGLSRKEFAELFDMYPGTYSGIENGNSTAIDNCITIADVLGWTLDYLVGHDDKVHNKDPQALTLDELLACVKSGTPVYAAHPDGSPFFFGLKYCGAVLDYANSYGQTKERVQAIYGHNLTLSQSDYGETWIAYLNRPEED